MPSARRLLKVAPLELDRRRVLGALQRCQRRPLAEGPQVRPAEARRAWRERRRQQRRLLPAHRRVGGRAERHAAQLAA